MLNKFLRVGLLLVCVSVLSGLGVSPALARTPLLVEGKKTLYQRVISHPNAFSCTAPGQSEGFAVKSFTPFYIYGKAMVNGAEWLELSTSTDGQNTVWVRGDSCSRWDKALSLMIAPRMTRSPMLFFKTLEDLETLVTGDNVSSDYYKLLLGYKEGSLGPNSPLVAVEPADSAVPHERFYLMPVFEFSSEFKQYGVQLLKVGSIDPGTAPAAQVQQKPQKFNAGIAFIVDTTISMGPYIDKTKGFIKSTYDRLETSPSRDSLALAVVAYRNSTDYNPAIGYVSKVISNFTPADTRGNLERNLSELNESKVSTHAFNEDAFAGIQSAVDSLSWSDYAVKIAVLVTDAGAIDSTDKYSSTRMDEGQMRDMLEKQGIQLVVIHLHTQSGKRHNIAKTTKQYQTLSQVRDGNLVHMYVAVPADDSQSASKIFGKLAQVLAGKLEEKLVAAQNGQAPEKPEAKVAQSIEDKMDYIADCLGYAARLEFVGRESNTEAPQLVQAWTTDKDLITLIDKGNLTDTVQVTVLLNKRQLNSLATQLEQVVRSAEITRGESSKFFDQVISLAAQTVRDPEQLQSGLSGANIAEMGAMPEFLDGLPYVSKIMGMTQAAWVAMTSAEQDSFINELKAKLQLYKSYDNDRANWEQFGSSDPMEALYRVPLSSLP